MISRRAARNIFGSVIKAQTLRLSIHIRRLSPCFDTGKALVPCCQHHRQTSYRPSSAAAQLAVSSLNTAMSSSVVLSEREVRQVISAALRTALAVPQQNWSEEFVVESLLGELTVNTSSSAESSDASIEHNRTEALDEKDSGNSATSLTAPTGGAGSAAAKHKQSSRSGRRRSSKNRSSRDSSAKSDISTSQLTSEAQVMLSADIADLIDAYPAADAATAVGTKDTQVKSRSNYKHRAADSEDMQQQQQQQQEEVIQELQTRFSQLLYDNYQQVETDDIHSFTRKLLTDLQQLVQQALQDQSDDLQGVCALCGRDMPLTKHHLIPRDVHKEFKKRGFTIDQLQSGLMVCRPCHSAIHRAVPDNKELAVKYRTLEDLQEHDAIAKFSAWASKQRISSKTDATARHFSEGSCSNE